MTTRKAQDRIRDELVALVAHHAGVAADSITYDESIWQRFPDSRAEYADHPSVTSFVDDVHSKFDVWLTEEEWEAPNIDSLAERLCAKSQTPGKSVADWHRERLATQKGFRETFVLVNVIFGPLAFFSAVGSWTRRAWVALGILLFMDAMMLCLYHITTRRFRWKPVSKAVMSERVKATRPKRPSSGAER